MFPSSRTLGLMALAAALCVATGCEDDPEIRFRPSPAGPIPNQVRLTGGPVAGDDIGIQVVIEGPTTSDEIKSFNFGLAVGNPAFADFVPGSATAGPALQIGEGCDSIQVTVTPVTGGLTVFVGKLGPCLGNRVNDDEIIVGMTFRVFAEGSTTLALTDSLVTSGNPPSALDPDVVPIGSVTFDRENAVISKM